jgi:superfamily II DNA or RNA helicase
MSAYRNGLWDGKIKLFDRNLCTLYRGLEHELERFCKSRRYNLEIPNAKPLPSFSEQNIQDIVKERYPLFAKGESISPHDHQAAAVAKALSKNRCLLLSPTSSGKSLIAYLIIRMLQDMHKAKTLLVVPTTGLVHQMKDDFEDYSSKDTSWDAKSNIHTVFSGKDKQTDFPVVVSTWQSIYKQPQKYFEQFDAVIIDECHLAQATSIKGILEKMSTTQFRFGMTGTLQDAKCHQWVLEGLLGKTERVITTAELMEKNLIATLDIECIMLGYPDEIKKAAVKNTYQQEMEFLAQYEPRNEFIVNLAKTLKGNTLVLFRYVDKHGKPLYNEISKTDKTTHYIAGSVSGEERNDIAKLVEGSDNNVIVASYGTFSTGMSIRNLHNVIFASPYKSKIKVLQSIGRGLRKSNTKTLAKLFDIADDLSWKKKQNHTLKHMVERVKIYNKESFKYSINNIRLKR